MKIVCISDTHGKHREVKVPEGDVLVHAGDMTIFGEEEVYRDFSRWLGEQPHKHKIVIAGNHDFAMKNFGLHRILKHAIYLEDTYAEIDGVLFYGTPYTRRYGFWAYMEYEEDLARRFKLIPQGTDVLITHGPAKFVLDQATPTGEHLGDNALLEVVSKIRPKLHVFGHIHGGAGRIDNSVNASVVNEAYVVANSPVVVHI